MVLLDRPGEGLGGAVCTGLDRLGAPRMTIVSCDPATMARDLAALANYKMDRVILIDLFPQTYHLETVVSLTRR